MIYLFRTADKGERTRLPQVYNGLTLNDDTVAKSAALYELNIASINEQWDAVTEPKVANHGMEAYKPYKVNALIREDGIIRAPNLGVLMDAVRALNTAFDPVNAYTADSGTVNVGYLPLTFSIPTADLTNYPTGLITAEYLVRSLKRPVERTSEFEGLTCRFSLYLQAADPRCYFTTTQTASRSNAGTFTANNSLAGFPSWPIVTITLTGAGSQIVEISHNGGGGVPGLNIDLSSCSSGDIIAIDMEQHTILKNGGAAMNLFYSGQFIHMPTGSMTWQVANYTGTLAGGVVVTWGRAL